MWPIAVVAKNENGHHRPKSSQIGTKGKGDLATGMSM